MSTSVPRFSPLLVTSHELANEGSYFTAKNATAGTGLATAAAAIAVDHTKPFALVKGPTTPGKVLLLDYVRLVCTAPGTAGTSLRAFWHIDDTKADPTGGSTLTLNNIRMDVPNAFESKIFAGPLAAAAASGSIREIVAPLLKNAIPAAADVYLMKFGGSDMGMSTGATLVYYGGPPLIVPAGKIATLQLVLPSQSAASSYEIEIGGSER
jgi:hypothetical protein